MGTCKTCRWWYNHGTCDFVDQDQSPSTRLSIKVTVADDHDLDVSLRTGPDFGCIHHTLRENTDEVRRVG